MGCPHYYPTHFPFHSSHLDHKLFFLIIKVLVGAWLNGIGAGLRIISGLSFIPLSYKFTVVMIGQSISSFAQPFVLNSPTKLAALWFGANERATANMLASLCKYLLHDYDH